jgi:hypothetical protein
MEPFTIFSYVSIFIHHPLTTFNINVRNLRMDLCLLVFPRDWFRFCELIQVHHMRGDIHYGNEVVLLENALVPI